MQIIMNSQVITVRLRLYEIILYFSLNFREEEYNFYFYDFVSKIFYFPADWNML